MSENINDSMTQAGNMVGDGLFDRASPMPVSDWLLSQAQQTDNDNISLDTIKAAEKEKIMKSVKDGISVSKKYYENTIEPAIDKRDDLYAGDEDLYKSKFPVLSDMSKFISYDIHNSVEWIEPSLVEAFTGSDTPVTISGVSVKNDETATKLQQLIMYQLTRKNNYTTVMKDALHDALKDNFGAIKCHWRHEETRERYEMMLDINDMQTALMLTQGSMSGEIEIIRISPVKDTPDLYKVVFEHIVVTANYPVIEYLPPSELRFTPEAADLQECKFVAHRKIVKGDYLKRKEQDGTYRDVDLAIESAGDTNHTTNDKRVNPQLDEGGMQVTDSDNASKDVELYECYVKVDYNDDGIYEHLIVHCVGDVPLSIQKNEFEIAPFFPFSYTRDSRRIFPEHGIAEILEPLQDLKTALIKQLVINIAKNNSPQRFIDEKSVDMDALLAGSEYIPVSGEPSRSVYDSPSLPFSSITMDMVNYAESEIENRSGSTKYNQGLDANSLNQTATGITAIMGQSDKRIKLSGKLIAENSIVPMIKFMILMNKKFGDQTQTFRYKDKEVTIDRSELDIDYDMIINIGNGAGTKEARIQSYMALINNIYPTLASQGVATAKSYYMAATALLEEIGLKNTTGMLLDPDSDEAKQLQQQKMQQQIALLQTQEKIKAGDAQAKLQSDMALKQLDGAIRETVAKIPSIRANFNDLPVDTQMSVIQDGLKAAASPEGLIGKELMKHEKDNFRDRGIRQGAGLQDNISPISPQPGTGEGPGQNRP